MTIDDEFVSFLITYGIGIAVGMMWGFIIFGR